MRQRGPTSEDRSLEELRIALSIDSDERGRLRAFLRCKTIDLDEFSDDWRRRAIDDDFERFGCTSECWEPDALKIVANILIFGGFILMVAIKNSGHSVLEATSAMKACQCRGWIFLVLYLMNLGRGSCSSLEFSVSREQCKNCFLHFGQILNLIKLRRYWSNSKMSDSPWEEEFAPIYHWGWVNS